MPWDAAPPEHWLSRTTCIADRFFLGGPSSLRGFKYKVRACGGGWGGGLGWGRRWEAELDKRQETRSVPQAHNSTAPVFWRFAQCALDLVPAVHCMDAGNVVTQRI